MSWHGLSILDRFRPVDAPGPAAGVAGVPAADDQGPAAELAPVFAALAADVESCRKLVEEARREADGALFRAHEQAAIAQARLDAGAEACRRRGTRGAGRLGARCHTLLEQAGKEAGELEEAGTALLPATVRKVIDNLLSEQS